MPIPVLLRLLTYVLLSLFRGFSVRCWLLRTPAPSAFGLVSICIPTPLSGFVFSRLLHVLPPPRPCLLAPSLTCASPFPLPLSVCECFASRVHFCFISSTLPPPPPAPPSLPSSPSSAHVRAHAWVPASRHVHVSICRPCFPSSVLLLSATHLLFWWSSARTLHVRMQHPFFLAFLSLRALRPLTFPVPLSRCVRVLLLLYCVRAMAVPPLHLPC